MKRTQIESHNGIYTVEWDPKDTYQGDPVVSVEFEKDNGDQSGLYRMPRQALKAMLPVLHEAADITSEEVKLRQVIEMMEDQGHTQLEAFLQAIIRSILKSNPELTSVKIDTMETLSPHVTPLHVKMLPGALVYSLEGEPHELAE